MITDDGCLADYRVVRAAAIGRPCLFLDRDGVLIEDTGYPHDPALVVMIPQVLDLVSRANAQGFLVGVVSNQSGIGRGYFSWEAFAAVQGVIDAAAAARGGRIDFVLACPHHPGAALQRYRRDRHPWRKPAPGMLIAAGETLGLDMAGSAMVGDRASDMAAARLAGIPHRALLSDAGSATYEGAEPALGRGDLGAWFARATANRWPKARSDQASPAPS